MANGFPLIGHNKWRKVDINLPGILLIAYLAGEVGAYLAGDVGAASPPGGWICFCCCLYRDSWKNKPSIA